MMLLLWVLQAVGVCERLYSEFRAQYNKIHSTTAELRRAERLFCGNLKKLAMTGRIKLRDGLKYSDVKKYLSIESDMNQKKNYGHKYLNISEWMWKAERDVEKNQEKVEILSYQVDWRNFPPKSTLKSYNRENFTQIVEKCSSKQNIRVISAEINKELVNQFLLKDLPPQIDLRKFGAFGAAIDQGTCGSCYAVASTYVFQSMLLRDINYYKQIAELENSPDYEIFKKINTKNAKLSVQYILNGTYGFNYGCGGGNSIFIAQQLATGQLQSLELDTHYKYVAKFNRDDTILSEIPHIQPIKLNDTLNPIHFMSYDDYGCPIAHIVVSGRQSTGYSDDGKQLIKSVLARGIAVAASMHTEGGTESQNQAFTKYKTGIFRGDCRLGYSNHQIAYIGYGTYKRIPVWIIANTWGQKWGMRGTFMVEQGSNALCTEMQAVVSLNRFHGFKNDTLFSVGDTNEQQQESVYQNLYNNFIRDGITGLDHEDGSFKSVPYNWLFVVIMILIMTTMVSSWVLYCINIRKNSYLSHAQRLKDSISALNSMKLSSASNSQVTQSPMVFKVYNEVNQERFILKTNDPNIVLIKIRPNKQQECNIDLNKGYTDEP